jgi:hypothetical protein
VVRDGQCSALGAEVDGERQSGVGKRLAAGAGRGENGLLLRTDSERRRCTGRRLHALRMEAGRLVARVGAVDGAVGTQRWRSTSAWSERRPGAHAQDQRSGAVLSDT